MIDPDLELIRHMQRDAIIAQFDFARFMTDSNAIEGEAGLNPGDLEAAKAFVCGPLTKDRLLECHGKLARHLGVDWAGRFRDCNVRVGQYIAPPHEAVPGLMAKFWRALPQMDAWQAHNRFQKIHPFEDLNGRTGRLIWLHRAIDGGYTGQISFLHQFYYQTLAHERPLRTKP